MAAIYMAVTFYKFHLGQHARINNQYFKKKKERKKIAVALTLLPTQYPIQSKPKSFESYSF